MLQSIFGGFSEGTDRAAAWLDEFQAHDKHAQRTVKNASARRFICPQRMIHCKT
jgi:hypothetical protein